MLIKSFAPAVLLTSLLLSWAHAQSRPVGQFEHHEDVGGPAKPGSAVYDDGKQIYSIIGSGTNMWTNKDEFHYVWKRMRGNFILRTRVEFVGQGVDPHRKIGWIVRPSLDPDAAHVNASVHGDGHASLQFRRTKGAQTERANFTAKSPDVIQLERKGNTFTMSVANFGELFQKPETIEVPLGDEVYVGLYVCAHNPQVYEQALFRDVEITVPARDNFVPYREYIGSKLEVMDLATKERKVLYRVKDSLQAPNWTRDGKHLIYNHNGLLYRFDLGKKTPTLLDTGEVKSNNNDHVISFDGQTLGISSSSKEDGNVSMIYTVPIKGGIPTKVTSKGPSYLHGWSPDKKFLVYAARRDNDFDIYKIPVTGGDEIRLTTTPGVDDGPEYTPDGQYIYFNSFRTGTMQIWRMKPDGSEQTQITKDEYNNWFPHISPDGKSIVFITFPPDIAPGDHPFYKHVYLRLMPVGGGAPQVIAYLYGGQGTINVPSWSPDSKKIAFVSNTDLSATRPDTSALPSPGGLTSQQDHQRLLDLLQIKTLRRGADGRNAQAPNAANYDESKANPYPNLPDPLVFKNGGKVTTAKLWWDRRRQEIFEDFDREIYGRAPKKTPKVKWEVVSTTREEKGEVPVITKQLVGHVDNSAYPQVTVDIRLTLTTPAEAKGPVPVIMELSFGGPRPGAAATTPAPGGVNPPSWQQQVLGKGWGYAVIIPTSIQPDNGTGLTQGIIGLVNKGQPRKLDDWGALRAWAWGASRALDYFETDKSVDARQVGLEGHSRYGKAVLVAMAYDPRFAVAFVSSSGAGGAKLHRRNWGELVENVAAPNEYHWMAGNYLKYAGPLNWNDLPVDSHELMALCAPRPVFISAGATQGDGWVDAKGMFLAAVGAGPVYQLLGKKDLGTTEFPSIETTLIEGEVAFRQHSGGHTPGPNWPIFLTFADRYLRVP
ncbi:MAG TPA: hypothetical protein VJ302_07880 [Blastocatellia bacterium]|nr:hypothetical protein [Blastocatellia bacterium]